MKIDLDPNSPPPLWDDLSDWYENLTASQKLHARTILICAWTAMTGKMLRLPGANEPTTTED